MLKLGKLLGIDKFFTNVKWRHDDVIKWFFMIFSIFAPLIFCLFVWFSTRNFLHSSQGAIAMKLSGIEGYGVIMILKQGCHDDLITGHVTSS